MAAAEAGKGYDPFAERLKEPTAITDGETLTHLIKTTLGTGILSMSIAFYYVGLYMGLVCTMFTALICGHCALILVKCAHFLYFKLQRSKMTYAEVAERVILDGPICTRKLAVYTKLFIIYGLFLTYFGTLSVYAVIVAKNFQQVIEFYMDRVYNERILILLLLIPLILLTWIPNLKKLAPVSFLANVLLVTSLVITCYYTVIDVPPLSDRDYIKLNQLPAFFAITIFSLEAIGMILPLENNMQTPTHFLGFFGVLSRGMVIMGLMCSTVGFLGYWQYGPDTAESITLNLPVDEMAGQIVKLLIGISIFCTFGLQFMVCLEISWNAFQDRFPNNPTFGNYVIRTILVVTAVGVAVAVPTIAPFIGLIGAFCFSTLGLIMPVILETILCLETGFGKCAWILWKNIFIFGFGIGALIFGTSSSIQDIMKIYE